MFHYPNALACCFALGFWAGQPHLHSQNQEKPIPTYADVAYGEHERQVFDLWITKPSNDRPTPLAIYIHGGGFRGGDKNSINAESIQPWGVGAPCPPRFEIAGADDPNEFRVHCPITRPPS